MRLTHLGHACILVETGGARILIDPGVLSDLSHLDAVDAVLLTHGHADHVDVAGLAALLEHSPGTLLVTDADSRERVEAQVGEVTVAAPGDRISVAGVDVEVLGGIHAAVYGDVPGCTNNAYLIDGFLHPGDSFTVPERPVDALAVPIAGPWLKVSDAVDYVRAVAPRVAVPIHEGETTDPAKYAGMVAAFGPEGVVRRLVVGEPTDL